MHRTYLLSALVAVIAPASLAFAQSEYSGIGSQIASVIRLLTPAEVESHSPSSAEWFCEIGVLISSDGLVVSNAAISKQTDDIVAMSVDGAGSAAKVVGRDRFSNLALFKISGSRHQLPAHGNAEELVAGEVVYAIGATPDGLPRVVTTQVRDARRLVHSSIFPIGPYIEIDNHDKETPITGPIFNQRGKVVGFVVLQSTPEQKTPVVLAIPISDVKRIADELRTSGKVRRSRIGVDVKRVPDDVANARGLVEPAGAFIAAVGKRSPAERAGLAAGDIILRLAGAVIRHPDDYMVAMGRIKAGTRILLEVLGLDGKRVVSLITGEIVTGPPVGQPATEEGKVPRPE
jgi:serine protease Do